MPPTFLYILALEAYVFVACIAWIVAGFFLIFAETRMVGKKIAFAMVGSFPGVFMFQVLSAPIVLLVLLGMNGAALFGRPPDVIVVCIVLFIISIPVVASLLGFYIGWRVGWEVAAGRASRALLCNDPILAPVIRFLARNFPSLERTVR